MISIRDVERHRLAVSGSTTKAHKAQLGQYFTPASVASFMASLFSGLESDYVSLLDAGAGNGILTAAFLERWLAESGSESYLSATSFEIDPAVKIHLERTIAAYGERAEYCNRSLTSEIVEGDFIEEACHLILTSEDGIFTHAILNPPYKKIRSDSVHREQLRIAGIETVNLYAAFLEETAIKQIHLFTARDRAFKDDGVLQENVIVHLVKGESFDRVTLSTSSDGEFSDLMTRSVLTSGIIRPDDPEYFIRIPDSKSSTSLQAIERANQSLSSLGLEVSTGPVVDFRLKEYLRHDMTEGCVPLLYPGHFEHHRLNWPIAGWRKPNAIVRASATERWLYPRGCYVVVRRFSSKEERRRIVASVVLPDELPSGAVGFENHLNVFHKERSGLPESLAFGLMAYLNSSPVDGYFREFNGHTQVNATDLRSLPYPPRQVLTAIGERVRNDGPLDDTTIDSIVGNYL
ncbi:SAM-dependent methyltransferase [Anaerolineae bacterium CFX4]|nr:SAM-dependent methyltransferase [Anaerolineae bacterium CFX4]